MLKGGFQWLWPPWAVADARHSRGRKRLALPPRQPREILMWAWAAKDAERVSSPNKHVCVVGRLWRGLQGSALSALNLWGHVFMVISCTNVTHTHSRVSHVTVKSEMWASFSRCVPFWLSQHFQVNNSDYLHMCVSFDARICAWLYF